MPHSATPQQAIDTATAVVGRRLDKLIAARDGGAVAVERLVQALDLASELAAEDQARIAALETERDALLADRASARVRCEVEVGGDDPDNGRYRLYLAVDDRWVTTLEGSSPDGFVVRANEERVPLVIVSGGFVVELHEVCAAIATATRSLR